MALIDREELLCDIKLRMRSDNVFSDPQMNKFVDIVIINIGDDENNYAEVLCKSLRSIAENNAALATDVGQQKVIQTEKLREEFYKTDSSNTWDDYLGRLDRLCASFGYTELDTYTTGFMVINPGEVIDVNPLSSPYLSYL